MKNLHILFLLLATTAQAKPEPKEFKEMKVVFVTESANTESVSIIGSSVEVVTNMGDDNKPLSQDRSLKVTLGLTSVMGACDMLESVVLAYGSNFKYQPYFSREIYLRPQTAKRAGCSSRRDAGYTRGKKFTLVIPVDSRKLDEKVTHDSPWPTSNTESQKQIVTLNAFRSMGLYDKDENTFWSRYQLDITDVNKPALKFEKQFYVKANGKEEDDSDGSSGR